MHKFFYPDSVAVIGVSPRPGNLGRNIVANLETAGFGGEVFLVSPRGGEYHGRTIHPDVADLPYAPDLAVILTPAASVPELMEACGNKGIKRVVIESGGFSELDAGRGELERRLRDTAERHDMRFIGPNCIGVINTHHGLAVPFPLLAQAAPQGGLSIVAQSGGVGLTYLHAFSQAGVGIAKFASVGNKVNVNERDLLAYLIEDEATEIILLYLESIVAGRDMFDLIKATDKPVVVHKSNIGETSHGIAQSHTAALANDDAVVDAALAQAGAHRVRTVTECQQIVKGLTLPAMKGRRLAVVSRSGGHAVVAADAIYRAGLELAQFPPEYLEPIQEHTRASVIKLQNPLDLGDLFDFPVYSEVLRGALALPGVDGVLFVHGYRGPEVEASRQFVAKAGELCRQAGKPVALVLLVDQDETRLVQQLGTLPIFPAPDEAVAALSALAPPPSRPADPEPSPLPALDLDRCWQICSRAGDGGWLGLAGSLELARAAGLPVADFTVAATPLEAAQAAGGLGFPVVLKADDPGLTHKTEAGGVVMGLADADSVEQAAGEMQRRLGPVSLVVMTQAQAGLEVIAGGKRDPAFGPVALCGLGGVAAEALADVALGLAPLSVEQAGAMWAGLRGAALLGGFRGRPAPDRAGLIAVLMRVSELMAGLPDLAELDLNPLLAASQGVVAVDARARVRPA